MNSRIRVQWDLRSGEMFMAPTFGTIYKVRDTYPHSVRVEDMEGFIFPLSYQEIHDKGCFYVNAIEAETFRAKVAERLAA